MRLSLFSQIIFHVEVFFVIPCAALLAVKNQNKNMDKNEHEGRLAEYEGLKELRHLL